MFILVLSSIAAFSLAGLAGFILIKKRSPANVVLSFTLILLAAIELIGQAGLRQTIDFEVFREWSLIAESILPVLLLIGSIVFGRIKPFASQSRGRLGIMFALALLPPVILISAGIDLYVSPDFCSEKVLFLADAGYWFYLAIMASMILALVHVEATLASTRGIDRSRIKFQAFGILSLLAVMVFYYSQALLYRTINMNLVPVRSSVFVISAVLIGYSQIFRETGARVSVSRHIFYRSVTLLIIGVYLIGLALIGEGMRYFGLDFGRDLTIVLAFAGGVLLLAVLFSEKARRITKVYIHKHFYADKHDYREEWLRLTGFLSKCSSLQEVLESVVTAYLETFGFTGACLYLLNNEGTGYARAAEQRMPLAPMQITLSKGLHEYLVARERILDPEDGEYVMSGAEASVFNLPKATLIIPLISNGKLEALLVLHEQLVPRIMIYDDFDLMKVMARQAAQAIAGVRLSEQLIEMRAMAAVAKISSFVIHDLKNLTTGLSLVVDNAELHMGNPDFQKDAIKTIGNTLLKMQGLMQRLKSIPEKSAAETRVVDIDLLVRETIQEFNVRIKGPRIEYAGAPVYSRIDREEVKSVIVNLVQNAIEVTGERGTVMVRTNKENGNACIVVSDNGAGMSEDFMKNHLFRPFRTTKGKGLGIGLYQSRQIVEAHSGRIEVTSAVSKGTTFRVVLPSAAAAGIAA